MTLHRPITMWSSVIVLSLLTVAGVAMAINQTGDQPSSRAFANTLPVIEGAKVTIEYRITLPDDTVTPADVTEYVQGRHEVPSAVEEAVLGMKAGEEKQVALSVDEAFGPYDEQKRVVVERNMLPAGIVTGMMVELSDGRLVRIMAVTATVAILDFNHPLAGMPIVLDVKVLKVERLVV